MFTKISLPGLLIITALVAHCQSVFACSCPGDPTETTAQYAINRMNRADAVFTGEVVEIIYRKALPAESAALSEKYSGLSDNLQIKVIKFKIYHWWKGFEEKEITLLTDTYRSGEYELSSSCEANFNLEHEYLVFAKGRDRFSLKSHDCGGSLELSPRNKAIYLPSPGSGKSPKTDQ